MSKQIDLSDVRIWVDKLRHAREQVERYKQMADEARDMIKDIISDDTETGTLDGKPVIKFNRRAQERISTALIRERHPELVPDLTETKTWTEVKLVKPEASEGSS